MFTGTYTGCAHHIPKKKKTEFDLPWNPFLHFGKGKVAHAGLSDDAIRHKAL